MLFQNLPDDMLIIISNNLSPLKRQMLLSYDCKLSANLSRSNYYKVFAANQTKLWFKIMLRYKIMNQYISHELDKIFKSYDMYHPVQTCVYYAPHIPNGMCRICSKYKSDHRFSERFITNNYINK